MQSMLPLSPQALAVFRVLTEGLSRIGDHRKIRNNQLFMPVSVEVVGTTPQDALIVSVAHYYEQNGDLMADPEITFVVARNDCVFPITFRQDSLGLNCEYVRWEDGKLYCNLPMQNDLAGFCDQWMRSITDQQFEGRLPPKESPCTLPE